jgi:hypothetical protein
VVDPKDKDAKEDKDPKAAKPEPQGPTPEQVDLIRFFRRAAVRALAKVRFDIVGGVAGVPEARPGYTLAKVAVADVSISPAPHHTEIAEAVIGLCGINPSPPLHIDEMAFVIAYGVAQFVRAKGPEDNARADGGKHPTPWRTYAARMTAAFNGLKRHTTQNARLKQFQQPVSQLADLVVADILAPLERTDATTPPNLDRLFRWMEQNTPKDKARSLYNAAPQYTFTPRQAGG